MQVRIKVTKQATFVKVIEVDDLINSFSDEIDFALMSNPINNMGFACECTETISDSSEFIDVDGTEVHKDLSIFKP